LLDQQRRQVVDAEKTQILERTESRGATGAAQTRDNHHLCLSSGGGRSNR
jgi:hypothetical protein